MSGFKPRTPHHIFKGKIMHTDKIIQLIAEDIKKHPEEHKHDLDSLYDCCVVDGFLDTSLLALHEIYVSDISLSDMQEYATV